MTCFIQTTYNSNQVDWCLPIAPFSCAYPSLCSTNGRVWLVSTVSGFERRPIFDHIDYYDCFELGFPLTAHFHGISCRFRHFISSSNFPILFSVRTEYSMLTLTASIIFITSRHQFLITNGLLIVTDRSIGCSITPACTTATVGCPQCTAIGPIQLQ